MVDVKPISQIVDKWAQNAGAAGNYYAQGASQAGNKWQANAAQSGANWQQGVSQAAADNRFVSGVSKAGAGKYTQGVQSKGASRFAGGVAAGKGNYNQGIQSVISTLQGVTLPARGPRGSPQNVQRVAAIAQALHQARVGGSGA